MKATDYVKKEEDRMADNNTERTVPLFTIIVPLFNAEKYISNTVESIRRQQFRDFEALIIDDGSSDRSVSACEEAVAGDDRFLIFKEKNKGVSAARNQGIRYARGKYILFVDSDDYIDDQMLQRYYSILSRESYDMIICGMAFDFERNGAIIKSTHKRCNDLSLQISDLGRYFEVLFQNNYLTSSCNKLIAKRVIDESNLLFNERISNYEDYDFSLRVLSKCEKIKIIEDELYHYINRYNGSNSGKVKSNMDQMLYVMCNTLFEDSLSDRFDVATRKCIQLTTQQVFWSGINNISRGKTPFSKLKSLISQPWVKEIIPMAYTGNRYNDVCVFLYKKNMIAGLLIWNKMVTCLRRIKYLKR